MMPASVLADLTRLSTLISRDGRGVRIGETVVSLADLDEGLSDALYTEWYLGGTPADASPPSDDDADVAPSAGRLTSCLRAAHAGSRMFEPGWMVLAKGSHGSCLVGRGDERRVVHHPEYVGLSRPGVPVAPGEQVAVTLRVDTIEEATRWWATQSPNGEPQGALGRFYLHPNAETAPAAVHELTTRLLRADFCWSLKASTETGGYQRPDAVVLYVPRVDSAAAQAVVAEVASRLRPETMHASTPPLTLSIAPGIGYAEDPGPDTSFGTSRCRALAPGARVVADGALTGSVAVRALAESLEAAGIDPAHPWQERST